MAWNSVVPVIVNRGQWFSDFIANDGYVIMIHEVFMQNHSQSLFVVLKKSSSLEGSEVTQSIEVLEIPTSATARLTRSFPH